MKKLFAVALLVTIAAVIYLWMEQPHRAEPSQTAPASRPESREIVLRLPTFALNLNPLKMSEVESRRIATLLHSGLVAVDAEGAVHPRLATRWVQTGPLTWRFELRSDVTFADGVAVSADSAAASLCASMQPSSPWAWALRSIEHRPSADGKTVDCTGIRSDAGVLELRQSSPTPWLMNALASPAGWILPAAGATEQPYGVLPGIGAYAVEDIVADESVRLKPRAGGVVEAGASRIVFKYLPDAAIATQQFLLGKLDALDVDSPAIVDQLFDAGPPDWKLKAPGRVLVADSERVRVVIVNEKRLAELGFNPSQISEFKARYAQAVDRDALTALSRGIAQPMFDATLLGDNTAASAGSNVELPPARLVLNMEPDSYSDLLAASLPRSIGAVQISYAGLDKGVLVGNLINGAYDLDLMIIESPVRAPSFWTALFTPGDPFSAFGKPIDGMQNADLLRPEGVQAAANEINRLGNWIGIIRERRIIVSSERISGIYLSPSGQPSLELMKVR